MKKKQSFFLDLSGYFDYNSNSPGPSFWILLGLSTPFFILGILFIFLFIKKADLTFLMIAIVCLGITTYFYVPLAIGYHKWIRNKKKKKVLQSRMVHTEGIITNCKEYAHKKKQQSVNEKSKSKKYIIEGYYEHKSEKIPFKIDFYTNSLIKPSPKVTILYDPLFPKVNYQITVYDPATNLESTKSHVDLNKI